MGLIITIGGASGSGKSTVGRMLATRLGIPFFSMGDVRRQYARQEGISILDVNKRAEADFQFDKFLDEHQAQLLQHGSFVVDSRLGFHFLPATVKVYIKIDRRVAAERIFMQRRESEHWHTIEDGVAALAARDEGDRQRYMRYYTVDPAELSHYDIILDSTTTTPLELLDQLIASLREKGVEIPE